MVVIFAILFFCFLALDANSKGDDSGMPLVHVVGAIFVIIWIVGKS